MTTSFSPRAAALLAVSGYLLAARPAHAQSAPPPQPYPGAYAPYAAPQPAYGAPAWPGSAPAAPERQSSGMMGGGITLIVVGSVGSIVGAALLAAGTTRSYAPCPFDVDCVPSTNSGLTAGGATMVAISTASLIVGIPLLAVGMRKVPARPEAAALVPEVRLGATGGTLRWQF